MSRNMKQGTPPTLLELESIRQELVQRIGEAHMLFAADTNVHEMRTNAAALKSIEEMITSRNAVKRSFDRKI